MPRHEAPQPGIYLCIKHIPPTGIYLPGHEAPFKNILGHEVYTSTRNIQTYTPPGIYLPWYEAYISPPGIYLPGHEAYTPTRN